MRYPFRWRLNRPGNETTASSPVLVRLTGKLTSAAQFSQGVRPSARPDLPRAKCHTRTGAPAPSSRSPAPSAAAAAAVSHSRARIAPGSRGARSPMNGSAGQLSRQSR